jgi:hypothetical protein
MTSGGDSLDLSSGTPLISRTRRGPWWIQQPADPAYEVEIEAIAVLP